MAEMREGIVIEFEGATIKFDKSIDGVQKAIQLLKREVGVYNAEWKNSGSIDVVYRKLQALKREQELINDATNYWVKEVSKYASIENRSAEETKKLNTAMTQLAKYQKEASLVEKQIRDVETALQDFIDKNSELSRLSATLNDLGDKFNETGQRIESAGRKLQPFSRFFGNQLREGISDAESFELAFANVVRVLDDADPTQVQEIEKGIRDMATRIPASAEELAGVVQLMAQLGIQNEDLLKFSETMINIGNTTDLTAEQAGEYIAKLYNIMGSDINTVDNFGSALLDLGRKSAATEHDIAEMAFRVSAAGRAVGMSEQEVLALATALSSVGLKAQAGGSSISRIMYRIQRDVVAGGEDLKMWADVAGMSAKDFADKWDNDVANALNDVIAGMHDYEDEGGKLIALLDELDVSNIRDIDALGRLAGKEDSVAKYLAIANSAWADNSVLVESTGIIYDTFHSKLKVLKDNFAEFRMQLAEFLMPVLERLMEVGMSLMQWLKELPEPVKQAIAGFAVFATALSPVLIYIGKMSQGIGVLLKHISGENGLLKKIVDLRAKGLTPVSTAFNAVKNTISKVTTSIMKNGLLASVKSLVTWIGSSLKTTLSGILNPFALVTAAIVLMYTSSETFRKAVGDLITRIKDSLKPTIENAKKVFETLYDTFKNHILPVFTRLGNILGKTLIPLLGDIWTLVVEHVIPVFESVAGVFGTVVVEALKLVADVLEKILGFFQGIVDYLEEQGFLDVIGDAFDAVGGWLDGVSKSFSGVSGWLSDLITKGKEFLGIAPKVEEVGAQEAKLGGLYGSGGGRYIPKQYTPQIMSGGYGGISLYNTINVTNTGKDIDRAQVQRWGREIADVVNYHLGRRI